MAVASIDLSLRSTGITVLSMGGSLEGFCLITPAPKEWNDEALLLYIAKETVKFLENFSISAVVIEGLSFNSFSSEKDKINGNFWHLRCYLTEQLPGVPIGIISVNEWRKSVISAVEQREVKKSSSKDALKKACVMRLPKDVEEQFSAYISRNKHPGKCLYDLTDAYFLGKYRLTLE